MNLRRGRTLFPTLLTIAAIGCASKTADLELEAARGAMDQARQRKANECARETFQAAEAALLEAHRLADSGEIEQAQQKAAQAQTLAQQASAASSPGCDEVDDLADASSDTDATRAIDTRLRLEDTLRTIYFDYNDSTIRPESKVFLSQVAEALVSNPANTIEIEGHCDVRGSTEYNLHLGERRARSVQKYLLAQGVASSQVSIISYGEERPADLGQSERSHQLNRRAELTKN